MSVLTAAPPHTIQRVTTREQAAADALASLRLEGLEPSREAQDILAGWARGELTTDELDELAARAAAGQLRPPAPPDSK